MACPICAMRMEFCFIAKVLRKYSGQFEVCNNCGFLRAHAPYWLDEAYSQAITAADTGLLMRNITLAWKLCAVLYWILNERGEGVYLDAAGGYGLLTRLMRDFGFDFHWSDKYCQNFAAVGFEYKPSKGPCRGVTAMEVFEHLTDPVAFIKETLEFSGAQTLIFTTELYEGAPPRPEVWWYYTFSTGQHIGFFQRRTLAMLGQKLGLHFASANGLHIFSKEAINERLLRVVTSRFVSFLAPWLVRRRLGSKTINDHLSLLQRID